jgi:fucokinase
VVAGNTGPAPRCTTPWQYATVTVEGPARIDLGGGWSDTPPFCIDWGGTVLNIAVLLNGSYPIQTSVRKLREPLVRCVSDGDGLTAEYRTCEEILRPPSPGDPFSIPRTALRMTGLFEPATTLAAILKRAGGGIEIRTTVNLPMGSGLGTSSILAATILRALAEMMDAPPDNQGLSEQVLRLEQMMTTGGGWQDQAGGIFPGAKLLLTGPGLEQRLRVQPVSWMPGREAEFESLLLLYYTGVRRVARDLLRQVVGRYLARETACLQVLHSIKTLATEMAYAMQQGEWDHLGALLDRHWELNQILDPNTTNALLNALLAAVRPFIRGAKLAGAGGGGFLILLARSPAARQDLHAFLREYNAGTGAAVCDSEIAKQGLRVNRRR